MEDSAMFAGKPITWHYNVSTERRNQSRLNLEEIEENDRHKVNMVELNSNSFRLDSSLPIIKSITFPQTGD